MTADIDSQVLEHLRHLRARIDQIAEDVTEIKWRLNSLEFSASRVRGDIAHGEETSARQQAVVDRLGARLDRLERRLEISDAP